MKAMFRGILCKCKVPGNMEEHWQHQQGNIEQFGSSELMDLTRKDHKKIYDVARSRRKKKNLKSANSPLKYIILSNVPKKTLKNLIYQTRFNVTD